MKLWKENNIDQEYELSNTEIMNKFTNWYKKQEDQKKGITEYRGVHLSFNLFIGDKDGLNSVANDKAVMEFKEKYWKKLQSIVYGIGK